MLLNDNGIWICEFSYLPLMLKNLTFDQISKLDFEDKNIPTVFNCRECGAEVTTTKICTNCHAKFPAIDSKSYKKLRKAKVMLVAGLTIIVITIVIKLLEK